MIIPVISNLLTSCVVERDYVVWTQSCGPGPGPGPSFSKTLDPDLLIEEEKITNPELLFFSKDRNRILFSGMLVSDRILKITPI